MSAVSRSVMPRSIALWTTARVSSRPMRPPKLLQPSPTSDTRRPDRPRFRYSTAHPANSCFRTVRGCHESGLADTRAGGVAALPRSEEHTSELQSLMRISYAVFCLKKKNRQTYYKYNTHLVTTTK